MGIQGLLPLLEKSVNRCNLKDFFGSTVAIDTYCWLHKAASVANISSLSNEDYYVEFLLSRALKMRDLNIKVIFVFDGQHYPAKANTEKQREEKRNLASRRANELLLLGKHNMAQQYFRQSLDIGHTLVIKVIKKIRTRGIDCIVAPYEADAQLAYLNIQGIADLIITEDSDLLLFGCLKVMFKYSPATQEGDVIEQAALSRSVKFGRNEFTFDQFRRMCILSGCDYLESLPGIGLKTALKALIYGEDIEFYKMLSRLQRYAKKSVTVTEDYIRNFKKAEAAFKYQVVYDPRDRKTVRLNPVKDDFDVEYLEFAGVLPENDQAFQLALGNVHPVTYEVVDTWNPDAQILVNGSIWRRRPNINVESKAAIKQSPLEKELELSKKLDFQDNSISSIIHFYKKESEAKGNLDQLAEKKPASVDISNHRVEPRTPLNDGFSSLNSKFHNPFIKLGKTPSKFVCVETEKTYASSFFAKQDPQVESDKDGKRLPGINAVECVQSYIKPAKVKQAVTKIPAIFKQYVTEKKETPGVKTNEKFRSLESENQLKRKQVLAAKTRVQENIKRKLYGERLARLDGWVTRYVLEESVDAKVSTVTTVATVPAVTTTSTVVPVAVGTTTATVFPDVEATEKQ